MVEQQQTAAYSIKTTATGQFGDARWLPMMLAPLDRELTRIFFHQNHKAIEAGEAPLPLRHRDRYIAALARLSGLFKQAGFHPIVTANFIDLGLALVNLDGNIVADFLRPIKSEKHAIPAKIWEVRAFIAIALDVAARDPGIKLQDAAILIANKFPLLVEIAVKQNSRGAEKPKQEKTVANFKKWRDLFLGSGEIPYDVARQMFEERNKLIELVKAHLLAIGLEPTAANVSAKILEDAHLIALEAMDVTAIERVLPELRRKRKRPL